MEIEIQWHRPIPLAKNRRIVVDRDTLPSVIPNKAGVYFFSRKYGNSFQPLYIGETKNIRGRLRGHLNNADIRDILRGIPLPGVPVKRGNKYFHFGTFVGKRGQNSDKCLDLVQKYLIEQAITQKSPLLNKQLTDIKTHSVVFSGPKKGRAIFPKTFDIPR
ncbi:MAG TPA: GIY-YIG nuclease family protein [Xanthobacteraceae bacterium]